MKDRGKLDDTLAAMFSNPKFRENYLFYAHMIGQCSIKIDRALPAPAGVAFINDHYELFVNPDPTWVPFELVADKIDPQDIKSDMITTIDNIKMYRMSYGFDEFPLVQRLGVLKHEMLHILYNHVNIRMEDRKPLMWNIATDCAINQLIVEDHLPEWVVRPEGFAKKLELKSVPLKESSEVYYELMKKNQKEQENNQQGQGQPKQQDGQEQGQEQQGMVGSHETWGKSKGDKELQQDVTKKMIEKSQAETIKSKGNVPMECSDWLEMFSRKAEINWKKALRGIVGNKRVGSRSTIMRNDRRFPKRADLRGKTKERVFNLLVISDVSGSMSDYATISTWAEVRHVCDVTKTDVDLIQVDSQAYKPEKLSKKTKRIGRKGHGGTVLHPALEMAKQHNIDFQAVVVLTDGGLFGNDITHFQKLNRKVIWLVEESGMILEEMNQGKMRAYKLKGKKNEK